MGRYNNKRTQAAAQAAKNTPSRARFSKGPPNKGGRGNKNGGRREREPPPKPKSRGIGGSSTNKQTGRGGRNRGNPQTTARVIDKIQNRVGGPNGNNQPNEKSPLVVQPTPSAGSSSIDVALRNLDKSKLDVVAVSKETQTLIADLLRELGVVGGNTKSNNENNSNNNSSNDSTQQESKGMNPNASSFNPTSIPPQNEEPVEMIVSEDDNADLDNLSEDDNSEEQNMYDFLVEESDARRTKTAMFEDNYCMLDENDEDDDLQKRDIVNRRKQKRQQKEEMQNQLCDVPEKPDPDDVEMETAENDVPSEAAAPTIATTIISEDKTVNDKSAAKADDDITTDENFENDRTYLHLTQTLSFSHSQASNACRAIECWETNIKPPEEASSNDTTKDPKDSKLLDNITTEDEDNKMELAMDWLCLHLSEAEINRGFRPNPSKASNAQSAIDNLRKPMGHQTKIKAVAHPSISVISQPIEEQAKEWARAIALQERTLKMMRLGFHRADAIKAFRELSNGEDDDEKPPATVLDDPSLPLLLSRLQDGGNPESGNNSNEDQSGLQEDAREEREQELEALKAIYDDRLEVLYQDGSSSKGSEIDEENRVPERYILKIDPATPLGEPARADECFLHVLLRDQYPLRQTPLLLLVTKPVLPPSLCRKILLQLGNTAREILGDDDVGCPVVFEVVSYLEDNLPILHKAFCNEQRRKEFEAEQARLLKQRQIEMERSEKAMELLYNQSSAADGVESSGLGRRQRAKLKAAEKAFDRPEQAKALYEEYRRKQEERVKAAQHENRSANVRATKAQQAILNRQKELIDGEAERAARSAMNEAFRQGKSREEARAAAEKARVSSYKENGVTIVSEGEEEKKETMESEKMKNQNQESSNSDSKSPSKAPKPTEASSKFMERLRGTATKASTVTIDASTDSSIEVKKKPTKGPTPNTSAFMDRLREMYENAAKSGKNAKGDKGSGGSLGKGGKASPSSKLDGYHLESPEEENEELGKDGENSEEEPSTNKRPRPVAVPAGELVEVMTDIITQQEDQPWLVSSEARAPTTHNTERKKVSPAQLKREKEISNRLKNELSRKRRMAKEWAESNSTDDNDAGNNQNSSNKKSKSNGGKGRKKQQDNSFTPERFHSMMEVRQRLPAFQLHDELVQTIDRNQITVIAGATGCGKTTQVPQLVLDDLILRGFGAATNMIVTQPRRISAIGVSERIAQERCEKVGETCGYSIKLEKKMSAKTRLLLCTTGVLLRRLQCDPDLASVSHIFVDEVHERDLNTDFLIIILKDLLARRKDLKLVLMSATLNADSFSNYFGGCPVVSIPGRAHPVQENRLEDILELTGYQVEEDSDYALKTGPNKSPKISKSALRRLYYPKYSKETIHSLSIVDENVINYELLSELLEHISLNQGEGAILVFCPGFQEIQKTIEEMYKKEYFQGSNVVIYPLHSSLSTDEQVAIFEIPPPGVRKIVVSTNIAETSITIEDVVFVVDTGRVKENRRDEVNETPTLEECWVSRASAKQRRGRAGRVRPGIAYHLYSSHTHDDDMLEYQPPEMLRVGIEDLVLQILILDLGEPTSFLKKALDPPSNLALSNSLRLLEELGAVDCRWKNKRNPIFSSTKEKEKEEEDLDVSSELTALGFHLATLPVDPRVGKMMIYGALFGCIDPLLTFAAAMSARSPFVSPFDQREQADEARKTFSVAGSDHLTILNAFNQWSELRRTEGNRVVNSFLKENFLGRLTLFQMEDLRKQFHSLLTDIGFLPKKFRLKDMHHTCNNNSQNQGLIKAILCAGLYPNIIVAPRTVVGTAPAKKSDKKVGENAFRSHTKGEVYLHPSTIAFDESKLDSRYCCYHELVRTSKTYVRDCTTVSPFALLLFGGTLEVYQTHGVCSVDGWLKFRIDAKPATLIKYLRGKMERLLFQKIVSPQEDVIESDEGKALIQSISRLFETEYNLQKTRRQEDEYTPDRSGGEIVRPWTGIEGENDRINAIQNERRNNNRNWNNGAGREGRGGRGGRGRGGRRGGRSGRGRASSQ